MIALLFFNNPPFLEKQQPTRLPLSGILRFLINLIMGAYINQDYFPFGNHHFKADPATDID